MNIQSYIKTVKPENLEKKDYNSFMLNSATEVLYSISPNKDCFELKESPLGYTYHELKKEDAASLQNRCTQETTIDYATNPKPKKKEKRKRKDKKLLYKEVYDYCKYGGDLKKIIYNALQTTVNQWSYIFKKFDDKYRCFLSNSKGTPAYEKKFYWEIHDFCKNCDNFYSHKYFLTLTMSQKKYKTDLYTAWNIIQESLSDFLKAWQKKYKGDYACVLEAHKSGFPHIHIVLYTNRNIDDPKEEWDSFKKAVCLCSGEMFEWVNKHWKLGINVLKVNHGQNTCDYLGKYISKSSDQDIRELTLNDLNDDSVFKSVMTLLLPMIFEKRQFKLSQGRWNGERKRKKKGESEFSISNQVLTEKRALEEFLLKGSELEEFRTLLKSLCNKLPPTCYSPLFQKSGLDFRKAKPITPENVEKLPILRNIRFSESGKQLSCKGCIKTCVLDWITKGESDIFIPKKNWFYFADYFINRLKELNPSVWHSIKKSIVEEEAKKFLLHIAYIYKDLGEIEEIRRFASGVYTTDRRLFKLVFPKKWHKTASYIANSQEILNEKMSQNEVLFIKNVIEYALN